MMREMAFTSLRNGEKNDIKKRKKEIEKRERSRKREKPT